MSVLSITFHSTESISKEWENYLHGELQQMVDNLLDAEKYLLSEVQSDMIAEGRNTNLMLIFDNEEKRQDFIEIEFQNITERIHAKFGDSVMIFDTALNPLKYRF